jgi:hypothetical protein
VHRIAGSMPIAWRLTGKTILSQITDSTSLVAQRSDRIGLQWLRVPLYRAVAPRAAHRCLLRPSLGSLWQLVASRRVAVLFPCPPACASPRQHGGTASQLHIAHSTSGHGPTTTHTPRTPPASGAASDATTDDDETRNARNQTGRTPRASDGGTGDTGETEEPALAALCFRMRPRSVQKRLKLHGRVWD